MPTPKKQKPKPAPKNDEQTKAPEPAGNGRPIIYPDLQVYAARGEDALTRERAREFLGWEEEPEGGSFGADFLLKDRYGKKVRCHNNFGNRHFTPALSDGHAQELLRKRWRLNGETLIIGKTGQTISCQHRLIGLELAAQDWERNPDKYREFWPDGPPTMETIAVLGVDEADDVVNTIDTGRPRTLADVIYRSPYFAKLPAADRDRASKAADKAIRFFWRRTCWEHDDELYRTNPEAMAFLEAHPRLLEAISHVIDEYKADWENNNRIMGAGQAAALLVLFASSLDKADDYKADPREASLGMELWDKAEEFWTLLASNNPDLRPVRQAIAGLPADTVSARAAVLCKAWNVFRAGKNPTPKQLALKFVEDREGFHHLVEWDVTCDGIDLGEPTSIRVEERDVDTGHADPTPKQIERKADQLRNGRPDKNGTPQGDEVRKLIDALRKLHPDRVLFFLPAKDAANDAITCWEGDAETVHEVAGIELGTKHGRGHLTIPSHQRDFHAKMLVTAGYPVTFLHPDPKAPAGYRGEAFEYTPPPKKAPTPKKG